MAEGWCVLPALACTNTNGQPWTGARFPIGSPPATNYIDSTLLACFVCTFYALSSGINAATFPVLTRLFTRLPPGSRRINWLDLHCSQTIKHVATTSIRHMLKNQNAVYNDSALGVERKLRLTFLYYEFCEPKSCDQLAVWPSQSRHPLWNSQC